MVSTGAYWEVEAVGDSSIPDIASRRTELTMYTLAISCAMTIPCMMEYTRFPCDIIIVIPTFNKKITGKSYCEPHTFWQSSRLTGEHQISKGIFENRANGNRRYPFRPCVVNQRRETLSIFGPSSENIYRARRIPILFATGRTRGRKRSSTKNRVHLDSSSA
jgi:hypothetical protein